MKQLFIAATLFMFSGITFALGNFGPEQPHETYYDQHRGDIVVMLAGSDKATPRFLPGVEGSSFCFDVDLVELGTNQIIGTGMDCVGEIEVDEATGNINIVGTTVFKFPEGTLTTQGPLAIRPVDIPMKSAFGMNVTHITGAGREGNTIVSGTGKYANATANVRLSGMVDMELFNGTFTPIGFSCLFVISNIELNK